MSAGDWYGPFTKDGMTVQVRMIALGLWQYNAFLGPLKDLGEVEATNRVEAWNKAWEAARFDGMKGVA